jgi:hypothetical protein
MKSNSQGSILFHTIDISVTVMIMKQFISVLYAWSKMKYRCASKDFDSKPE